MKLRQIFCKHDWLSIKRYPWFGESYFECMKCGKRAKAFNTIGEPINNHIRKALGLNRELNPHGTHP